MDIILSLKLTFLGQRELTEVVLKGNFLLPLKFGRTNQGVMGNYPLIDHTNNQ